MIITAVVVCDGRPDGLDPCATIGDEPMVVRAVRGLLGCGLVEHVEVLAPDDRAEAAERACRGLPVSVRATLASIPVRTHVDQRAGTGTGDGSITTGSGEILLLHDAARPLAPPELAVAVVEAVRRGLPAAVPVLPMSDTVKQLDGAGLVTASPDRATLRVVQTPMALRWDLVCGDWARGALSTGPPLQLALRLAESGVDVHTVAGHPLAFAVRTAWDLELAELLVRQGSGG